jgi:hypothetical protein
MQIPPLNQSHQDQEIIKSRKKSKNSIIINLINLLSVFCVLGSYLQDLWFGTAIGVAARKSQEGPF